MQHDAGTDSSDERMAEILKARSGSRARLRDSLRAEATPVADDMLARLSALEFVDAMVGDVVDVPERLGEYRITGLLGRGGMGTVYAAFQESLEREVALKVLSPAFSADPLMRARFRSEARATASLHHLHIVPIYDFGETHGVLFFAMEKVDGVSLDRHIAAARRLGRAALEARDAAGRFAGVAEALFHAHRRGILHRDVKPANLLVAADGTLALADFGLSKVLGEVSHNLTAGGAFLGTLAYAPPEQAKGRRPTPASDLYSLGVTMFEAVTGELPLRGSSTEAMLDAVLNGTPRRLRDVAPRAPKDLEVVIDKLLQKDAADRYADGEELARDLRRVADGEPVRIRRQPLWQRAWRKARRNPHLAWAIALAAVLAVVTLVQAVVNRREYRVSMEARHTNLLQEAMAAASRQAGSAIGPPGLLMALTGGVLDEAPALDQVLVLLDRAGQLLPDDPAARELRGAYVADPLPEATELLRSGFGHRARTLLDAAIVDSVAGFEARDNATWLKLYGYYLARAVACLTQSVAEPEQARMDLFAASFVRSGAFFPKLLLAFVDWKPQAGSDALIDRVRDLVDGAPAGAGTAAGVMMRAFAGLHRTAESNLLRVSMTHVERRALHAAAQELLDAEGVAGQPAPREPWTGLERALAEIARQAIAVIGDRGSLEPRLGEGLTLLRREVDPGAPLQSWGFVFQVLADPGAIATRAPSWPTVAQLQGWMDLLRLDPPRLLVHGVAPRIRELLETQGIAPAAVELRARLNRAVGTAAELGDAARAWYEGTPDEPEALLCRFEVLVAADEVQEATYCAAELLQQVVDRAAALPRIVQILRAAEERGGAAAAAWAAQRRLFEEMVP